MPKRPHKPTSRTNAESLKLRSVERTTADTDRLVPFVHDGKEVFWLSDAARYFGVSQSQFTHYLNRKCLSLAAPKHQLQVVTIEDVFPTRGHKWQRRAVLKSELDTMLADKSFIRAKDGARLYTPTQIVAYVNDQANEQQQPADFTLPAF